MQSTVRPLVKNRGGDLTDSNNYRAVALANMETKILESILMEKLHGYDDCDNSVSLCVLVCSLSNHRLTLRPKSTYAAHGKEWLLITVTDKCHLARHLVPRSRSQSATLATGAAVHSE